MNAIVAVAIFGVVIFTTPSQALCFSDEYEPDDDYEQAGVVVVNASRFEHRTFHDPQDTDWVKFYAVGGESYTLETANPSDNCDTAVRIYDTDGATMLAEKDYHFEGEGESLDWNCESDGIYFANIRSFPPSGPWETMTYDWAAFRPHSCTTGKIAGVVFDAETQAPIADARIRTGQGDSALGESDGTYEMRACEGPADAVFQADGYESRTFSATATHLQDVVLNAALFPLPDTTAPTGTVSIRDGEEATAVALTTLSLAASDDQGEVVSMRFSNDGNTWSPWEDYSCSKSWTVSPGEGIKRVYVQFEDDAGNRTAPLSIFDEIAYITKAVVIAGGNPCALSENTIREQTANCAGKAFRALISRGYPKHFVTYLSGRDSDADGDGQSDVDCEATKEMLQYVLFAQADETDRLLVYFAGHGGDGSFCLDSGQTVGAAEWDQWLDALQASVPEVIFIHDACWSGSFIGCLRPADTAKRVVVASASEENAAFLRDGKLSFSYQFWEKIEQGANFADAFLFGKSTMRMVQTALLEADANGEGNETSDYDVADGILVGYGDTREIVVPEILACSSPRALYGDTSSVVQAGPIRHIERIDSVCCRILPPCHEPGPPGAPLIQLAEIAMTDHDADGIFEASYGGFCEKGTYVLSIDAIDLDGRFSLPVQTEYVQSAGVLCVGCDIDGDGETDLADAEEALRVMAGQSASTAGGQGLVPSDADIDGDGKAGLEETLFIMQQAAQIGR